MAAVFVCGWRVGQGALWYNQGMKEDGMQRQDIQMAVIDLDETLLHDDASISAYTHEVLARVRERGVRVVIATGRMFCSARQIGRSLGLGDVPLIAYSGGLIARCESGEILYHQPLDLATANEILALAREVAAPVQVYLHDRLLVPAYTPDVEAYERHCQVKAEVAGEAIWRLAAAPTKIIFNEPDAVNMARLAALFTERFGGRLTIVKSSAQFFEMVAPHVSKGIAAEQLALRYGVDLARTMAFGNAQNDMSMLRAVGWPVAVANAIAPLREMARVIAPSNEEDGVAQVLAQAVLGEEQ